MSNQNTDRNDKSNCCCDSFPAFEVRKDWELKIPMRRGGTPDEVAKAALFLASDLSSYVSGQVINVCGAMNT